MPRPALGLLDHHLATATGGAARRRRGITSLHRTLHVGHFLGPLVDQENDQEAFGMVGGNGARDVLQDDGLAGARLRDDQRALAFAERRDQIDDARGHVLPRRVLDLHLEPFVRIERRQIVEVNLVARLLRILEVDAVDFEQREIALALFRAPDFALNRIDGSKRKAPICEGECRCRRDREGNSRQANGGSRNRPAAPRRRLRR